MRDFGKAGESSTNGKDWFKAYRILYAQKQATIRHQTKSSAFFHPTFVSLTPTHRFVIPETSPNFHPFSPAIYRPIPSGIFRKSTIQKSWTMFVFLFSKGFCPASNQQTSSTVQSSAQHHIYCQPLFGLKWVVLIAGKFDVILKTRQMWFVDFTCSSNHGSSFTLFSSCVARLKQKLVLLFSFNPFR